MPVFSAERGGTWPRMSTVQYNMCTLLSLIFHNCTSGCELWLVRLNFVAVRRAVLNFAYLLPIDYRVRDLIWLSLRFLPISPL